MNAIDINEEYIYNIFVRINNNDMAHKLIRSNTNSIHSNRFYMTNMLNFNKSTDTEETKEIAKNKKRRLPVFVILAGV